VRLYSSDQARWTAIHPRNPAVARHGGNYGAHKRIGMAIGSLKLPYSTRINGMEAGLIPYYSQITALDIVGLNDNTITRGTREQIAAYKAANPIDIDVTLSTSGAADDFARGDGDDARRSNQEAFEKQRRDFYYAGGYFWGVDPRRAYFNMWVRKTNPDAPRICEALIAGADLFMPVVAPMQGGTGLDAFDYLEFPGLGGDAPSAMSTRDFGEFFNPSASNALRVIEPVGPLDFKLEATDRDPFFFMNNEAATITPSKTVTISFEMKLLTPGSNKLLPQLYWSAPGAALAERTSMTCPLSTSTEWQQVTFPVGADPAWYKLNKLGVLRFDPIDAPGAFEVRNPKLTAVP
ncbi:MAG: hypothetical protein ABI579_03260, partial [Candidatus Sumerlaeota bacterium]